jgi:hypothetical protein
MLFKNSTAELMRLNGTGALGIGTTSPTAFLDVRGLNTGTPILYVKSFASATAPSIWADDSTGTSYFKYYPNGAIENKQDSASNNGGSIKMYKAGNSSGAGNPTSRSAELGWLGFFGYNGSSMNRGAYIISIAREYFNVSTSSADLEFYVTPNGSLTNVYTAQIINWNGTGTSGVVAVSGARTVTSASGAGFYGGGASHNGVTFNMDSNSEGTIIYGYSFGDEGILRVAARQYDGGARSNFWNANSSTKLFVTASGKVGINMQSVTPTQQLDVNGSINVSAVNSSVFFNGGGKITSYNNGTTCLFSAPNTTGSTSSICVTKPAG